MSDTTAIQKDYAALNELIVNCPEFRALEAMLGGFNLFRVLAFEHGEIRHSNVLAWMLDPDESHGLDSTFLQKWLMRVIHEAGGKSASSITPVDIDAWRLDSVEVRREWRNIDLLLILNFIEGHRWVICIENKINSTQHSSQLSRYRSIVETEFSDAGQRLYLFLTKSNETPEDDHYLPASYAQVHSALKECLDSRSHAIGSEPKVLLQNYLRLLEEKFMDESEIARTALKIYQQHRRALDVIFEHRPDNLSMASERVRKLLASNAEQLGISMDSCAKSSIRFVPRSWIQPGNSHGANWPGSNRTVLFELGLSGKLPILYVVSGKAPEAWIGPLWERSASAPFHRKRPPVRPTYWYYLHSAKGPNISLEDDEVIEPDQLAQRIYDWCVGHLREPNTQAVIDIIAAELPRLEEILASSTN